MIRRQSIIVGSLLFALWPACDSIDPKKPSGEVTPTPEEILNEPEGTSEVKKTSGGDADADGYQEDVTSKFFRTGTQYIYAVAKVVGTTGAALRSACSYERISSKFPKSTELNDQTLALVPAAITAYARVASCGCDHYLGIEDVQNLSVAELTTDLSERVFIDASRAEKTISKANAVSSNLDADGQKRAMCMFQLTMGLMRF